MRAEPEELLLIRTALLPYRAQLTTDLWTLVTNPLADPDERFRCVAVLAAFDPDNPFYSPAFRDADGNVVETQASPRTVTVSVTGLPPGASASRAARAVCLDGVWANVGASGAPTSAVNAAAMRYVPSERRQTRLPMKR